MQSPVEDWLENSDHSVKQTKSVLRLIDSLRKDDDEDDEEDKENLNNNSNIPVSSSNTKDEFDVRNFTYLLGPFHVIENALQDIFIVFGDLFIKPMLAYGYPKSQRFQGNYELTHSRNYFFVNIILHAWFDVQTQVRLKIGLKGGEELLGVRVLLFLLDDYIRNIYLFDYYWQRSELDNVRKTLINLSKFFITMERANYKIHVTHMMSHLEHLRLQWPQLYELLKKNLCDYNEQDIEDLHKRINSQYMEGRSVRKKIRTLNLTNDIKDEVEKEFEDKSSKSKSTRQITYEYMESEEGIVIRKRIGDYIIIQFDNFLADHTGIKVSDKVFESTYLVGDECLIPINIVEDGQIIGTEMKPLDRKLIDLTLFYTESARNIYNLCCVCGKSLTHIGYSSMMYCSHRCCNDCRIDDACTFCEKAMKESFEEQIIEYHNMVKKQHPKEYKEKRKKKKSDKAKDLD